MGINGLVLQLNLQGITTSTPESDTTNPMVDFIFPVEANDAYINNLVFGFYKYI